MNINELGEDLEQQFGKPRNITEENVRFMLSLIKEEFDGTKVNENVERPSLEAFGMTILAVMSYQTTPWEELAKKPSIRKTLKYIAIRGNDHYDEMEALTKELIWKHFDGITQKMVLGFLKIIRGCRMKNVRPNLLNILHSQPNTMLSITDFTSLSEVNIQMMQPSLSIVQ